MTFRIFTNDRGKVRGVPMYSALTSFTAGSQAAAELKASRRFACFGPPDYAPVKAILDAGDVAAVGLLSTIADSMPLRSFERDMVVCALLWLEGDKSPGGSVSRWWDEATLEKTNRC